MLSRAYQIIAAIIVLVTSQVCFGATVGWTASLDMFPVSSSRQQQCGQEPDITGKMATDDTDGFWPLLQQGEQLQQSGNPGQATAYFHAALKRAESEDDTRLKAVALSALGNGYLLAGSLEPAGSYLRQALVVSGRENFRDLVLINTAHLAGLSVIEGQSNRAIELYKRALALSRDQKDIYLGALVSINLADLLRPEEAHKLLDSAWQESKAIKDRSVRIRLLLALGYRASVLENTPLAYQALAAALVAARNSDDKRQISQALGLMGQLYEQQERNGEALQLTSRAISAAQETGATDLLMQWEWQQARLFDNSADGEHALAAYRRAVIHLQAIRTDIPVRYTDGRSSFRETLEPLLLGLADLLLRYAAEADDPEQSRLLLLEAQNTVELVKSAELQDYFLDTCAATQRPLMDIELLAPGTAVIYPILFADRMEILYGMGRQLNRVTVEVDKGRIERTVTRIVRSLRPSSSNNVIEYRKKQSGQLYELLVAPLEEYLETNNIHTLVYVPDGILRTLPISALWNDKEQKYLIEKWAVATSPGLTLMDPAPTDRSQIKALLAGLSRPGPSVNELPDQMKQSLAAAVSQATDSTRKNRQPSIRGMGISTAEGPPTAQKPQPVEVKPEQLQDALALPGVVSELDSLAAILQAEQLLDQDFLLERFKNEAQGTYRIIHIASHGFFSSSTENSFIMAYDHLLDMNELETMFKSEAFSDAPVELLTLSACQTAEGDDRSPLGLSGIALKSGARCALGSLWPISDESTQRLLPVFYQNLANGELTKAQALQKAQIALLRDDKFNHPFFWSSFILIGNWL